MFEDGKANRGEYRRFRVKSVKGPNDFASHQEVLRRRFHRARLGEEGSAEELRWRMPDLVILDGGKGQVSAAKEVLDASTSRRHISATLRSSTGRTSTSPHTASGTRAAMSMARSGDSQSTR